jgi:hypothetical protein
MLAYREVGRLGRELDRANAALAARAASDTAGREAAAGHDRDAASARAALDAERRRLAAELAAAGDTRAGLERQLAAAYRPQTNTPILALSAERGGAEAEPTHKVHLPKSPGWIVLSLDLDHPELPRYRVVLQQRGGAEVWRSGGLQPNENDSLVLTVPSTLLKPGDYALRVEGEGGQAVARFGFRAMRAR